MSVLIRDGALAQDDWTVLADDAALPAAGKIIVSLKRYRDERAALAASGLTVGVRIGNTEHADTIAAELAGLPLIAVEIPKFGDGRAYSQARVLRERYGYKGEIRAYGDVLRDQIGFMARCGINAFVPRADQDPQDCLSAFHDFDLPYQHGADRLQTVWEQRRAQR